MKVVKEMTPFIQPGDAITITLKAVNHKDEDVTEAVLSDVLPDGTSMVGGSSSHGFEQVGDMMIFDLGDIASGDTVEVEYQIQSSTNLFSERFFFDDMESGDLNWDLQLDDGTEFWGLQSFIVNSGEMAWAIANDDTTQDVSLITLDPITLSGDRPSLMFYQHYDTEKFFDVGILQISTNNGLSWDAVNPDIVVRGDLSTKVQYSLFAIPNLKAWNGSSGGWVPTLVDLSEYSGEDIKLRFRFGADGNTSVVGWFLDDIEVMDVFSYNSEACITTGEGDEACGEASRWGAVVASSEVSSVSEPTADDIEMDVYPNPALNDLNVRIATDHTQEVVIELMSSTGQLLWREQSLITGAYTAQIDTKQMSRGFYFVRIKSDAGDTIRKVVLQ